MMEKNGDLKIEGNLIWRGRDCFFHPGDMKNDFK